MILAIDNIIFSLQKSGGISAVWYEHLKRLTTDQYFSSFLKFIEYDTAIFNVFRKDIPVDNSNLICKSSRLLNLRRYLNPSLKSVSEPFLFHSSYYRTCSNKKAINITTVHDFTYEYFVKGFAKSVHCWQKYRAIRNSDLIICISENTKRDLLKFVPDTDENKVRVIHNGVSEDYFPIKHSDADESPFALFVGARGGYKNFDVAVEAIKETTLDLVIVGSPLSEIEIKHLDSALGRKRYKYAGRISNQQLNVLYNTAFCLLYPSSYEGFGIPVIEAQKAGCPVIAANHSSIPEIIGDKTMLINVASPNEILKKIQFLNSNHNRKEVIDLGLENAKRFSWDKTYADTVKVYKEVL